MNEPLATRRFTSVVCLVAALLALALGVAAFERKLASFQPIGLTADLAGDHWLVRTVQATGLPLEVGDRVVTVDGEGPAATVSLAERLRRHPSSRLLVLRGESLLEVEYQRPPLDLDLPWLVLAAIGMLYLGIGLFTLWKAERGMLFFAWCLASAVVYAISPVPPFDGLGRAIYLVEELARLVLPPLTLHLFLSIPGSQSATRSRPWHSLLYLPAALLLTAQLDLVFTRGRFLAGAPSAETLQRLDRLELVQILAFGLAAGGLFLLRLRQQPAWVERRQLQWLGLGALGGYVPFGLAYALPLLLGARWPEPVQAVAVVPLALVPVAFAWALLRYRLWDFGVMVREGLSYGLSILVGLGGFALLDLAIRRLLPDSWGLSRDAASFFVGAGIAGLVIPAQRRVSSIFARWQYRGSFRLRRGLAELGRQLLAERDLPRLARVLVDELGRGLDLAPIALLLADSDSLVPAAGSSGAMAPLELAGIEPALWQAAVLPVAPVALAGDPATALGRFAALGFHYGFPLVVRDRPVGLLLAGARTDGLPLNSEDLELARDLLDQAALAIENAQLLDQVQRQLGEVSSLRAASEAILESSPAGIVVLDRSGRVARANAAFAALVRLDLASLAGRQLAEILPLAELPGHGAGLADLTLADRDGSPRHLQLSVAALSGGDESGERILVVQDVSDRVKMEEALKEQDRLAAIGLLAAGVAHEVNTPLTGISSYAQLLLAETGSDDPRYELLQKVERQTFRAARIVNGLLDFARSRHGEQEPLELAALLGESVDLVRERLAKRRIELLVLPSAEPVMVSGCAGELQQVFTNLLLNAIDAMAESGGRLTLSVATDGSWAVAAVADSGPGIPPEHLDKIFHPFFTTKAGKGGTGLGLSISQQIVAQHGGRLRVENRPEGGARFVVELPRLDSTPAHSA